MPWYVSYRSGSATVMQVFNGRERAVAAAYQLLDQGHEDALQVGPMLENPEGKILDAEQLVRLRATNRTLSAA